jgi:uncharacterized protein with beta-barrel porin domain
MSSNAYARSLRSKLLGAATFAVTTIGLGLGAAQATVTPEPPPASPPGTDPVAEAVDTSNTSPYWVGLGIRSEAGNSGGTCTGLLINPRTVLFAAHCVDGLAPSAYDANTPGNRAQVGYTTDPTFGRTNLREWLFGQDFVVPAGDARVMDASSVMVWYDPRSRFGSAAIPNNGTFLPADVAIAGFGTATELLGRDAQSGIGLLFTPVAGLVPVTIGGYGQSGNGQTGVRTGAVEESYYRRLGQNMLGFLGDERTIALGIYPVATADILEPGTLIYQDLYWADFDDPQRATRPFFNGPGADPLCVATNPNCRLDHDPFPGDAVAGEVITAAGDSGSPLVTDAFGRDVSLGVLSQGSRFFYESLGNADDNFVRFTGFSNYGTTAGWNPLFLFWDQIVVNNPYKYVTTVAGDGEWTDPTRWVQELDPLYFTLAGSTLVNALPGTPALGVSDAAANVGTINSNPSPAATCAFTGTCPPTGGTIEPTLTPTNAALPGTEDSGYGITIGDETPTIVRPGYESLITGAATDAAYTDAAYVGQPSNTESGDEGVIPGTPANEPLTTALWSSGTLIPVGVGALTGPGTTNFVPDNTLGTAGLQNSTRWFEVNLRAAGTTYLTGTTVTIDRLSVRGASSRLNIRAGAQLNTVISSFLDAGTLTVNGIFSPSRLTVEGGSLFGTGSILTTAPSGAGLLVNGGLLSPGAGPSAVGTLSVTGNTAFTLAGVFGVDIASASSADLLNVNGQLQLGGGFAVNAIGGFIPSFGDSWTVASATGGITGSFAVVASNFQGVLRPELQTVGNNLQLNIIALPFMNAATFSSAEQIEIARALDLIRDSGGVASLSSLFDSLDPTPTGALPLTFEALSPLNTFMASGLAEASSALTSDMLSQRSEQLVNGGGRGFNSAGLQQLGLGPQFASADPFDVMMMGAAAFANAQEEAAEIAGRMTNMSMRQGWGGFINISTLVNTEYAITPFAGTADVDAISGSLGFDRIVAGGVGFLGAAISYNNGEATLSDFAQAAEVDSYGVSLYGGARRGQWLFDGQIGYSVQSYDVERTVPLLLGPQTLTGSPDGDTISLAAEVGREFAVGNNSTFTPFLGLDGTWATIEGYTEDGGSAAMTMAPRSGDVLDARLGVAYRGAFRAGAGQLRPLISIAYATDLAGDDNLVGASFAGFPSVPMSFAGVERDDSWVEYEVGLEYEGPRVGVSLNYTAADNGQLDYSAIAGRVSIAW